ncbi:uncharacterized protein CcaverHIS019_0605520 [Cutaneotrichosporon cavernicola]|uniref:Uncharacterized protein n=1 Tax=Cutaneotrichosporon cavernicola TaxID=279322 RepID=A0AA48L921_9TREE|nr:uncharacterized protein CcaverHIS019_0605520 [Cutaneotrichosporon cavernicola]BEI94093.1 hypothetical protein CcaverHIS019_0605520 [Cutaneotrichosporon cavernicola]BEJ01872.1 hypothetical protein CcaverHIS631_0605540 [Cutaneotrichosporon cavernicola]BEJ09637.1 hypothetical protein CcaverHIS641_0605520 [Cutaneotrichosporon cavernicola]
MATAPLAAGTAPPAVVATTEPQSSATDTAATASRKVDTPTILTTLHTLLRAHCQAHPSPNLPYLHPYAPLPPAPWKGKARADLPSAEGQLEALRAMRDVVDGARGVLGRRDEVDRVRLARAMREVITHESALLPLGTTLASLPPCAPTLDAVVPLPPAELLSVLGKRLGLQVFAEDSQFGLLRTSLTLAGSRFVVDVDLEMDAAEGDQTEPPTAVGTPAGANAFGMSLTPLTHAFPTTPTPAKVPPTDERGKVRLAKLTASHVTPAGEAGRSDWIAQVLRTLLEEHLACHNSHEERNKDVCYAACAAVESALAELKAIDELAEAAKGNDADLFQDLETLAAGVARKAEDGSATRLYPDTKASIYPSFRLLPGEPSRANPAFRFRPMGRGENVPPPPQDDGMAVDVEPMCRGAWLVELIDDNPGHTAGGRGLVVRRPWLLPEKTEQEGQDGVAVASLASGIKIEGLLYQAALEEQRNAAPALPLFPYATVFTHKPGGMDQYWSLAEPGPDGYIVGRVGLPTSWHEFGRLATALRAQVVLNAVFTSAFDPTNASDIGVNGANGEGAEDDGDIDLTDLDKPPSALPLTATLHVRSVCVTYPFPSPVAEPPTVTLELRPTHELPYITACWNAEPTLSPEDSAKMDAATKTGLEDVDAVQILARILAAL